MLIHKATHLAYCDNYKTAYTFVQLIIQNPNKVFVQFDKTKCVMKNK